MHDYSRTALAAALASLLVLHWPMAAAGAADHGVSLMIVVDRSGSVQRSRTGGVIQVALIDFVTAATGAAPSGPLFVEGQDVIGVGSFGGSWKLDLPPTSSFLSGPANVVTIISNIPFREGATNTAEGLYRAYMELQRLDRTQTRNIVLLITDGRPNAFTATFDVAGKCDATRRKTGYITATVGQNWPPPPPRTQGEQGIYTLGLFAREWTAGGDFTFAANSSGCHYQADEGQPKPGVAFFNDARQFPETDAYGNSTTGPVFALDGRNTSDPRAVRYASYNAADNMATAIRKDTRIRPALVVIGLNQPGSAEESLDREWLARVANDPSHRDPQGRTSFQPGQTAGQYHDATPASLGKALQQVAAQIAHMTAPPTRFPAGQADRR